MSATRALWLAGCCIAALALAVAMSVGNATASPRAAASQGYSDPVGDAGPGTDITNLTVTNDAAGLITIQVQSASPIVGNHAIAIFVDADNNQATGQDGDDYWFYGGPMIGRGFFAWNGSSFAEASPASFYAGAAAANLNEFRISKADLSVSSSFRFWAVSISFDPPSIHFWDGAPDSGYYSYTLSTPPPPVTTTTPAPAPVAVKPVVGAPVATPLGAVAGRRMTVSFPVTRSDNGKPLTAGKMICDPSVRGKVITHAESFKGGNARLSFVVPKAAKGKQLKVKVTIKLGTQSTTRVALYTVK